MKKTRIADLKANDIVCAHGGRFRVLFDAAVSEGHRERHWDKIDCNHVLHDGPVNCAWTRAVCLDGEISGYFKPGSEWTFQGTTAVTVQTL